MLNQHQRGLMIRVIRENVHGHLQLVVGEGGEFLLEKLDALELSLDS